MKEHESVGIMYVFDLLCGNCNEWFRAESEIDEPPRQTTCRHCNHTMYDDDDVTYTDSRFIGYIEIDLFEYKVIRFVPAKEAREEYQKALEKDR